MSLSAAEHALEKAKLGWSFGYKPGESPSGLRIVLARTPPRALLAAVQAGEALHRSEVLVAASVYLNPAAKPPVS